MAFFRSITLVFLLAAVSTAQTPQSSPSAPNAAQSSSEPTIILRATTRMVTIEVVARDRHGNAVTDLTPDDFQIFEQTTGHKKVKTEQKIAVFQSLGIGQLISQDHGNLHLPVGIYSNLVSLHGHPVPPTILLVDGINTELGSQMQIHGQMVRMLRSLPRDVPVAVFLLGRRLRLIQGFTTDPSLLKAALDKTALKQADMVQADPRDVPDSISSVEENMIANDPTMSASPAEEAYVEAIQRFEKENYASNMDMRVHLTADALMSLAHNVAGYPGRKNLLWLSSSFPIALNPELAVSSVAQSPQGVTAAPSFRNADTNSFFGNRDYNQEMENVAAALSQAKLAVYPIDMAGVKTEAFFDADTRTRSKTADTGATATREMGELDREVILNAGRETSMDNLASETGGRVCTEDNDLGDCVKRAVNDSSSFYEISYYPVSSDWNGEFRKVIVKTRRDGLRLSYREGYFARAEDVGGSKTAEANLRQAGCNDYLPSTSILLMAEAVPADSSGDLKYIVAVDAGALTFGPGSNGGRTVDIDIAVCTFNKSGEPLQLLAQPIKANLTAKDYDAVLAMHGLRRAITIPGPRPAAIRLVVRDNSTGHLGSINIPLTEKVAAVPLEREKPAATP